MLACGPRPGGGGQRPVHAPLRPGDDPGPRAHQQEDEQEETQTPEEEKSPEDQVISLTRTMPAMLRTLRRLPVLARRTLCPGGGVQCGRGLRVPGPRGPLRRAEGVAGRGPEAGDREEAVGDHG